MIKSKSPVTSWGEIQRIPLIKDCFGEIYNLPISNITHVCCCGTTLYREIQNGITWSCVQCGAKWLSDNGSMILSAFGGISCYSCYYHDFRANKIPVDEEKKYIIDHCRHARRLGV